MKKGIIIAGVIVVLIIIGILAYVFTKAPSYSSNNSLAPSPSPSPNPTPNPNPQPNPAPAPGVKTYDVQIANFAFSPATLTIKVGDTVTWTNSDPAVHKLASNSGEISSASLASGATYSHTFATAGTFAYYCSIHTSMKGTIIVE